LEFDDQKSNDYKIDVKVVKSLIIIKRSVRIPRKENVKKQTKD
jgi:hypothetical protein